MDEGDHADKTQEATVRLTIYTPEIQVSQRLCLCEYLALLAEPSSTPSPSTEDTE